MGGTYFRRFLLSCFYTRFQCEKVGIEAHLTLSLGFHGSRLSLYRQRVLQRRCSVGRSVIYIYIYIHVEEERSRFIAPRGTPACVI